MKKEKQIKNINSNKKPSKGFTDDQMKEASIKTIPLIRARENKS